MSKPSEKATPREIGLCPGEHTEEFYVPHGGTCPECEEEMVLYVPLRDVVEKLRAGPQKDRSDALGFAASFIEREFSWRSDRAT